MPLTSYPFGTPPPTPLILPCPLLGGLHRRGAEIRVTWIGFLHFLRELPSTESMDKLVQFGRQAWFIVRVMSGYEERRIRSYRLQLQKRLEMAQARKEELRKQPEKVILSEVRQVVQQMQALNQHLEEAESAIDEYFKPIDKNAKIITDMQLEKEEKQMKEMAKVMQEQIKMQREIAMKRAETSTVESNDTQVAEISPKQETVK